MIAVIRIHGQVGLNKDIIETFKRLKLKKKYSCVVIENPTEVQRGMIRKVKDFVAYGELDNGTYKKLVEARGKKSKTHFNLHPPRGGIDSKKHFFEKKGKGVLGNNGKEISKLIERML